MALRALPPGGSIGVAELRRVIANGAEAPEADEVRELIAALEEHGLLVVHRGRVRLPE